MHVSMSDTCSMHWDVFASRASMVGWLQIGMCAYIAPSCVLEIGGAAKIGVN